MSFIALDTGFYRHPKVLALGNSSLARAARDLYVGALMYSREHLTDGFVPLHVLADLDPFSSVKDANRAALALYSVGLFHRKRGRFTGYWILDYAKHQQTKEEVEKAKIAARRRKQEERDRKRVIAESLRDAELGHSVTGTPVTPTEAEAEQKKKDQKQYLPMSVDKKIELERILKAVRDADGGSLKVLERESVGLTLAQLAQVRYGAEHHTPRVGVGWVVRAFQSERAAA